MSASHQAASKCGAERLESVGESSRLKDDGLRESENDNVPRGDRVVGAQHKLKRKQYDRQQAIKALNDISLGMSTRKAAKKWGIPRTTLNGIKNGRYNVASKPGPAPVLTADEEQLLCDWLVEMCGRGIPINQNCLKDTVENILNDDKRQTPFKNGRPGKGWFSLFMKRHPEISQRQAESICRSRGTLTENCIRGWFNDCEKFFRDMNIAFVLQEPQRQYNTNESGFQLDPKCGFVLAPKGESIYTESGGNKEQVTALVTTRADGTVMMPSIVYPYKRGIPKHIVEKCPAGFSLSTSDSGWMTSQIFFEYLANVFIPEVNGWRRQQKNLSEDEELVLTDADWVVLWLDGYASHLTLYSSMLCDKNKMLLYCFKAHSSHICQPNDVGPFKPLKAEWKKAVIE